MSSLIATVTIYACDKALGSSFASCSKHVSCGRVNLCRDRGAFVKTVPTIVSRHDRNVADRRAAPIPDADREAEQGSYDCESEPEPADPASESGYAHISQ